MSAPFKVGDIVVCVQSKLNRRTNEPIIIEGNTYTISKVYQSGPNWFVRVAESNMESIFPHRFELASGHKTEIERKILKMEQRFIKHQQEKKNESMCCVR